MNYSKNLKKSTVAKRVLFLICTAWAVGLLIGGTSGYVLKAHITATDNEETEESRLERDSVEPIVYGVYDDETFTEEIPPDLVIDDLCFTSLNCEMPEEQQEFTYYLCKGYNVDFSLVMGLIQTESGFDPSIVSTTHDYGYMQINRINHQWLRDVLGVTDFTDPYENVRAGVFVLRKLFERYQDTNMVLMAYNMGEDAAARLWEKGVYSTNYTEKVLNSQRQFNEQLEGDADE